MLEGNFDQMEKNVQLQVICLQKETNKQTKPCQTKKIGDTKKKQQKNTETQVVQEIQMTEQTEKKCTDRIKGTSLYLNQLNSKC